MGQFRFEKQLQDCLCVKEKISLFEPGEQFVKQFGAGRLG